GADRARLRTVAGARRGAQRAGWGGRIGRLGRQERRHGAQGRQAWFGRLEVMPLTELFVFSSTPDVARDNFVVPLHTAPLDAIVGRAVELGFDGLEFLPDPDDVPDGIRLGELARAAGGRIGVINSGRLPPNNYALLHRDPARRRSSMQVFKRLIDLAGSVGARVGLG